MKFKNGDRVKRKINTYDSDSGFRWGLVIECYSKPQKIIGGLILGPYPELYSVKWDNGEIENGFLPHGLTRGDVVEMRENGTQKNTL